MKETKSTPQRKTTLKWNVNGELSSVDMARILEALSVRELSECELACNTEPKKLNLSMWWQIVFLREPLHWYKSEKFDPNSEADMYWV